MRCLAIVAMLVGCVRSASVTCPDGTVCREGTECFQVTGGYTCVGDEVVCGNGRREGEEACDDGNTTIGDGCSPDCRSDETCGNSVIDPVREENGMLVLDEQCDDGGTRGHDGCTSRCAPETRRSTIVGKVPRRRVDAAMATDVERRRILMFGGRIGELEGARTSNETWELDEDGWIELRLPVSPAPRTASAMTYTDDGVLVMFGGGDIDQAFADTWTFTGDRWSLVATSPAPPARLNHAMAFLPGVGAVVFGGADGKGMALGDTWIFADGQWTQFQGASPPARFGHTLTHDPLRGVLVLTTGVIGLVGDRVVDTWEFDGSSWTRVATLDAPEVIYATATFDRTRGLVLLDGGLTTGSIIGPSGASSITHAWNGQSWTIVSSGGAGLMSHASAADPVTGEMIVFGGTRPQIGPPCIDCPLVFDETYRLEGANWVMRSFALIPPMHGASACNDIWRRRAVLYSPSGGTYEMGSGSWLLTNASGPPARSFAAMAPGLYQGMPVSILFGGVINGSTRNDAMWTWNGAAWTERTPTPIPSPRHHHAMAFDARRGRTIVAGGQSASGMMLGDTWAWDGTTWSLVTGLAISPRSGHAMAYDPIRDVVLLFGGTNANNPLGDFWKLDASGWSEIEVPFGPAARSGAAMAWDAARQRIVLFGGAPSSDIWEWDGTTWTFGNSDESDARAEFPMVSSPTGAGVIAIGGLLENGDTTRDTLSLVWSTGFAGYAACRSDTDDDDDLASGCADEDCWAVCTPACPPGVTCDETAPRCGDGVCQAPRERCGSCADCPCP